MNQGFTIGYDHDLLNVVMALKDCIRKVLEFPLVSVQVIIRYGGFSFKRTIMAAVITGFETATVV
jgi:hypothetical protein